MVDGIIQYFRENDTFFEFKNMQFNWLKSVFSSPQQIFGIAVFEKEADLRRDWEKVSEEFAIKVQSRLEDSLYNLKWDMYLLLVVQNDSVDIELCKHIENNRMYFKKIVAAKNLGGFERKLPIELDIKNSGQLEVFSDKQFLDELRKIVSSEVANRLDFELYERHSIDITNDMVFLKPYISKGVHE
ncbi:ABC-three component system middle component 1 [Bacillus cereus]|uniref:ABC-three component system middle component 1 n=1 Tax=Bacillus cereus TaxID=1396 RepID=UPI000BF37C83|nr:ABC-three component system middle component 1 [Bacillus cereus]PEY62886.1 hypothetical protein CN356_17760 [Bacillus cereus]PFT27792.1 hypothetical protein COK61_22305 [Bacillus cereus]PFW02685.1 hypothetical protein COL12_29665 [Bacillus cereus]